jgi:vacuolar-type H+-ATPase subunit E/Vma4
VGIEELRQALEQEGRDRVAAILAEAEAEVERMRGDAERDVARERGERLAREEATLRRESHHRIAAERDSARRLVLEAREALLERVIELAAEELGRAIEEPGRRTWLLARAREALAHLPEGPSRLVASSAVAPALTEALADLADVRVEADPELAAGFRATSGDGAVLVDVTAPTLIEQRRATLAIDALRRLAQEDAATPGDAA